MAWQLIYTSAPRTLAAGQSGYGTVARSLDLRDSLMQRLEQLSYFQHGASGDATPTVVHAYRIVDVRGAKYHVLTHCVDAGLDFTNRTNHLAHHLVFTPEELAEVPSPPMIFLRWNGWQTTWAGEPRFLDARDWCGLDELPRTTTLPASEWARQTGDAGSAAALLTRPAAEGCFLVCDPGRETEWLTLFAESLQLLDPDQKFPAHRWQFPFTTRLQEQDQVNDFRWRGCQADSPTVLRTGWQVFSPADLPIPSGDLAELARRGFKKSHIAPLTPRVSKTPSGRQHVSAASPAIPTARPVRLREQDTKVAGTTACSDIDSPGEPLRSSGARRVAFISVATLLLLFLLTAYWRPGWLKRVEKASALREKEIAGGPADNLSAISESLLDSPPPKSKLSAPSQSEFERPPAATLQQLEQTLDGVPSYLFFATPSEGVGLPRIPELETLLATAFKQNPPLATDAIAAFVSSNRLVLSTNDDPRLPVRRSDFGRKTLAAGEMESNFELDATDWFRDSNLGAIAKINGMPMRSVSTLFRPAYGNAFPPFRISVLTDAPPLGLSKSLLRGNQPSFAESLDPQLRAKLAAIKPPVGYGWQLRPFIGEPPTDLWLQLTNQVPEPERELDFAGLRRGLQMKVVDCRNKATNSSMKISQLHTEIEKDFTNDIRLGERLRHKPDEPLASFHSFLQNRKREASRATFLGYLHSVLKGKLPDEELKKIDWIQSPPEVLQSFRAQLAKAGYEKELEGVPDNYFITRWESLGKATELRNQQGAKNNLDREVADTELKLKKVPESLSATPRVSLFLVSTNTGERLEIIRFTDPLQKAKP